MVLITKPKKLDSFLPPTPVTEHMRQQVEQVAKDSGVSKAHVMRSALSLFLSQSVNKADSECEEHSQYTGGEQPK